MTFDTRWFIRLKQSPEGVNRLLCVNGTGKYRAFVSKDDCEKFIKTLANPDELEPIELEVEE